MSSRTTKAATKKFELLKAGRVGGDDRSGKDEWVVERLPINEVFLDPDIQARLTISQEKVEEYASLYREGKDLPAIDGFRDSKGQVFCADGFHRTLAKRLIGAENILVRTRSGEKVDAILHAAGANHSHGLPRTQEDVRNAIRMVLQLPGWDSRSSREISRFVRCDHKTVEAVRQKLFADPQSGEFPQIIPSRKVTRGGKEYSAKIQKSRPKRTPQRIAAAVFKIDEKIAALFDLRHREVAELKAVGRPADFGVSASYKGQR